MTNIQQLQEAINAARTNSSNHEVALTLSRVRLHMTATKNVIPIDGKFIIPKEILGEIAKVCNRHTIPLYNGELVEHTFELTHGDVKITLLANTPKN